MREVAVQNEFISHYSFNGSWCPSNCFSLPAVYSGFADRELKLEQSEMWGSYATTVRNKGTVHMLLAILELFACSLKQLRYCEL